MKRKLMLVETNNKRLIECYIIATADKNGTAYIKVKRPRRFFAQWVSPKAIYEVKEQ